MLKDRLRGVKSELERRLRDKLEAMAGQQAETQQSGAALEESGGALTKPPIGRSTLETTEADPPVVARLMVEIRSDGTRTIARGALQDELSGEQVSLVAQGTTPLALAAQLAKNLLMTPLAAAQLARAMRRSQLSESKPQQKKVHETLAPDDNATPRRKH